MLADILREADPGARAVPMLLSAATDARHLARLGIQTYGFLPMNLPPEVDFSHAIHGADERIPVAALDFGTDAIYKVLERYGRQTGKSGTFTVPCMMGNRDSGLRRVV
jgi:acetylornithine deacetylase/succinyl-diaminopimelate desuccinylase-like protein